MTDRTAEQERADVVAWLRSLTGDVVLPDDCTRGEVWIIRRAADAIESGHHVEEASDGRD